MFLMNLQSNRAISLQPQDERTPRSIFKRSHLLAKTGKENFNMLFLYPDLVIQSLFYSAGSHCVGRFSGVKRGRSQPARHNVDQRNRGPQDVNISHWLLPLLRVKKHSVANEMFSLFWNLGLVSDRSRRPLREICSLLVRSYSMPFQGNTSLFPRQSSEP